MSIFTDMPGDDIKWGAFHIADAFILPSHQETYGMVVAEALWLVRRYTY